MRDIKSAKKELKFLKRILSEFQQDYDYAQSEEDLSNTIHQRFSNRIGDVYLKYKDLELQINALQIN